MLTAMAEACVSQVPPGSEVKQPFRWCASRIPDGRVLAERRHATVRHTAVFAGKEGNKFLGVGCSMGRKANVIFRLEWLPTRNRP